MPPNLSMPLADGPPGTVGYDVNGNPRVSRGFSPAHPAVDWQVRTGTPVLAAGAGKVTSSGWLLGGGLLGGGLLVVVDHDDGLETVYAHLATAFVRKGDLVRPGQQIALSGASGLVTGPHLHFEIKVNGQHIDPILYLRGKPLPGEGELDLGKLPDIQLFRLDIPDLVQPALNGAVVIAAVLLAWAGLQKILGRD